MFWVPEGTLSSKMIQNISIVDFHTLPYHQMTLLGLWRANLGPKLTPKRSNLTWFCNNLQFFTYHLYQPYNTMKFLFLPLIRPQWSFLSVLWPYQCPKWTPKKAKFDIFLYNLSICHLITFTWFCLPRMKPLWSVLDILWFYLGPIFRFWVLGQFLTYYSASL